LRTLFWLIPEAPFALHGWSPANGGQRIDPDGESHLHLTWLDSSGAMQSRRIDVYFESNYRGRITISIEPGNKVSWVDEIAVGLGM
jgi:hypothetical protein